MALKLMPTVRGFDEGFLNQLCQLKFMTKNHVNAINHLWVAILHRPPPLDVSRSWLSVRGRLDSEAAQ